MVCVYCSQNTRVVNSRPQKRLRQTWRRRICTNCGAIFTTIEAVDLATSLVIRHADGSFAPFSRDQLFISVMRSVGHRESSLVDAGALTATVTAKLLDRALNASLEPIDIIKVATEVLRNFDKAAAVQYMAYHKI